MNRSGRPARRRSRRRRWTRRPPAGRRFEQRAEFEGRKAARGYALRRFRSGPGVTGRPETAGRQMPGYRFSPIPTR